MTPALFFFVLSIGLFCWVLFLKLHLRLECDMNQAIDNKNIMLSTRIVHLECKLAKKKELLEIQDRIIADYQK